MAKMIFDKEIQHLQNEKYHDTAEGGGPRQSVTK